MRLPSSHSISSLCIFFTSPENMYCRSLWWWWYCISHTSVRIWFKRSSENILSHTSSVAMLFSKENIWISAIKNKITKRNCHCCLSTGRRVLWQIRIRALKVYFSRQNFALRLSCHWQTAMPVSQFFLKPWLDVYTHTHTEYYSNIVQVHWIWLVSRRPDQQHPMYIWEHLF